MSGYTIRTPATVLTTLIQDFQAAGSINPQDIRDLFSSAMSVETNVRTFAAPGSYTLTLTDAWLCVEFDNAANAVSFLIPTDASVAFQIGTVIEWFVLGTGVLTLAAVTPGTTTIRSSATVNTARVQYASGAIRKRAANDWVLMGDLT
jgi:hypothetical protein